VKVIRAVRPPVAAHQGGWDEILMFFVAPVSLFVILRWLGIRKERREQAERGGQDAEDWE
jgi:hypothetical protein